MKRYAKICNTCEKGPKGRRNWQKDVTNRVYIEGVEGLYLNCNYALNLYPYDRRDSFFKIKQAKE